MLNREEAIAVVAGTADEGAEEGAEEVGRVRVGRGGTVRGTPVDEEETPDGHPAELPAALRVGLVESRPSAKVLRPG